MLGFLFIELYLELKSGLLLCSENKLLKLYFMGCLTEVLKVLLLYKSIYSDSLKMLVLRPILLISPVGLVPPLCGR